MCHPLSITEASAGRGHRAPEVPYGNIGRVQSRTSLSSQAAGGPVSSPTGVGLSSQLPGVQRTEPHPSVPWGHFCLTGLDASSTGPPGLERLGVHHMVGSRAMYVCTRAWLCMCASRSTLAECVPHGCLCRCMSTCVHKHVCVHMDACYM